MAKAYINEYESLPSMSGGLPQLAAEPAAVVQTPVSFSTTTQSAAFSARTRYIGVSVDAICSYRVGNNPTATTGDFRLPADTLLYLAVQSGDKIAFVSNT